MSRKRAVIYGTALLLLGGVIYLLLDPSEPEQPRTTPKATTTGKKRPPTGSAPRLLSSMPESYSGPLTSIEGQARDLDSLEPVPDVRVTFSSPQTHDLGILTDAKGRYSIELPPGTYEVRLRSETHVAQGPLPRVLIEEGAPVTWLDFKLRRLATVAGLVVDKDSRPLAGASVLPWRWIHLSGSALPAGPDLTSSAARTDREGRFVLKVAPGLALLRAFAPTLGSADSPRLHVPPGVHLTGVTIRLGGGITLTGRVLGPGKKVLSVAEVQLKDELGTRRIPCDGEGTFSISGLSPGTVLLQASAPDLSPSQLTRVRLFRGKEARVVLQLREPMGVTGIVVDGNKQPVGGARVSLRSGSPSTRLLHLVDFADQVTTPQGRFSFERVPLTPLVLTATDGITTVSRSGVAPGSRDIELRLQPTGEITGQVTDGTSSKPVEDFVVSVLLAEGTGSPFTNHSPVRVVSPKGTFVLDGLAPGSYSLIFAAAGYGGITKTRVVVIGGHRSRVNVVLDAGGNVAGVVVDGRGASIPGAAIRMDTGWEGHEAYSDQQGHFLINDVARGRRSLTATHPAYDTRIVSGISVFPRGTAQVRVEMSRHAGKGKTGLRLSGIGAVLQGKDDGVHVIKVLAGSPAAVAGIRAKDVVVGINGQPVSRTSFADAIEAIRGVIGTPVRLDLKREKRTYQVDVIRDEVTVPQES